MSNPVWADMLQKYVCTRNMQHAYNSFAGVPKQMDQISASCSCIKYSYVITVLLTSLLPTARSVAMKSVLETRQVLPVGMWAVATQHH